MITILNNKQFQHNLSSAKNNWLEIPIEKVIENVLSDETYTTNEERVEAIKKGLATLVIPKDKYNDLSAKLKTTESNYTTLQTEFNDFKISKMTDDEKREAELKQLELDKKANAISRSELAVKGLLLDNGIKVTDEDVELKETLANIVSEDLDKSIKLANSFISLLNAKILSVKYALAPNE